MEGVVDAVSRGRSHGIGKDTQLSIRMIENQGVEGDVHAGRTVQHRSRLRREPEKPNLRQVHLVHGELHDELRRRGYDVAPGVMGENITTRGLDLLALPTGTRLHLGQQAVVEVTGLRHPCKQLEKVGPGLMAAVLDRDQNGKLLRKSGIMAIVVCGGDVHAGDTIRVERPPLPHRPLEPV